MSFDNYFDTTGLLANFTDKIDGGDTAQMMGLYRFGRYIKYKDDPEQLVREHAKFDQETDILTYMEPIFEKTPEGEIIAGRNIIGWTPHPGEYVRHPQPCYPTWASNPHTFSRDQQRSLVVAMGALKLKSKLWQLFVKHVKNKGWYPNDQEIDGTKKRADLAAPDILGEYIRAFYMAGAWYAAVLYPVLIVTDIVSLVGLLMNFFKWNNPDEADDDNLVLTLMQAKYALPTPISWVQRKIYKAFRPVAGYTDETKTVALRDVRKELKGPQSAIEWKHRATTGSPPFAELWNPILDKEL